MQRPLNVVPTEAPAPDLATVVDVEPLVVRQLFAEVGRAGGDAEGLCRGLGFDPEDLDTPEFRVSYAQTSRVIRRALRVLGRPLPGLSLGAGFNPVSWGTCLIGMMACGTVGEMLEFALDFQPSAKRLLALRCERQDDTLIITAETLHDDEAEITAFLIHHAFGALSRAARFAGGEGCAPSRAQLVVAPEQAGPAGSLLGCRVEVGGPERLVFADVGRALPTADPLVARQMRRNLTLARSRSDLRSELEEAIVRVARDNLKSPPTAEAFAASMNLSERTLRRRLQEHGTSFAALIDQERRKAVTALLQDASRSYAEIAEQTGFADVRSLRRAFKRWTGLTPSQARQPQASEAAPTA